ncbi:MAG: alpha/beta fold hydrolase [Treponema sp.]|jgi:pimeloyl-ACP methyl ester carboxylesterase|nr:alpha/beta fold hydrolase [Treponema sp.]
MNIKIDAFAMATVCFVLSTAGCQVEALFIYNEQFGRAERPKRAWNSLSYEDIAGTYPRETVQFSSGGNTLTGYRYGVGNNTKGLVVIAHGLGGNSDDYLFFTKHFVDADLQVFTYDCTGTAESEGVGTLGLYQSALDLNSALAYIERTDSFGTLPIFLVGHSWGGYAVAAVLNNEHPRVKAVVSFSGYNDGMEMLSEAGVSLVGNAYYFLYPQLWAIQKALFGDAMNKTAVDGINKSDLPVMVVHGKDDDTVSASKTSIYAHRGEITNPHVEIVYKDGDYGTGHVNVFYSRERQDYADQCKSALESFLADKSWSSDDELNDLKVQWAEEYGLDKFRFYELDSALMTQINDMFNAAR